MTIKEQYAANLVGHWDFRRGTFQGVVPNLATTTLAGNAYPQLTKKGWGYKLPGDTNDYFEVSGGTYPDLAIAGDVTFGGAFYLPYDVTANSYILGFAGPSEDEADNILYSVRLNSGTNNITALHEYSTGTNVATTSSMTVSPGVNFLYVIRDTVTKKYTFFLNGVFEEGSAYSDNPSGGGDGDLQIGALSAIGSLDCTMIENMIFDTALSQEAVAQMYEEWQKEAYVTKYPRKTTLPKGSVMAGIADPIYELDMTIKGNTIQNLYPNASVDDASVEGTLINYEGRAGRGVLFDGGTDSRLDCGLTDLIHELANASFIFFVEPSSFTDFDGFLGQGTSTTDRTRIGLGGSGAGTSKDILINFANGGTAASAYTTSTPLGTNAPCVIRVEFDGTGATDADKVKCYVNEVEQTLTFSGDQATLLSNVSANLYLFDDPGAVSREFRGVGYHLVICDRNLTESEGAEVYRRFAAKKNLLLLQADCVETTVSQTSGELSNTGMGIDSGTWDIGASNGDKEATASVVGLIYHPSLSAYGTWWWTMNKANTGTQLGCYFVCGQQNNAGTQEYYLYSENNEEMKLWNGSSAILSTGYVLSTGVDYSFCVTRTPKGLFTVYVSTDGGITYTSIGSVTSTTHTACKYLVVKCEAGDTFKDVRHSPLVIDPTI